jgi:hypothetical protein
MGLENVKTLALLQISFKDMEGEIRNLNAKSTLCNQKRFQAKLSC